MCFCCSDGTVPGYAQTFDTILKTIMFLVALFCTNYTQFKITKAERLNFLVKNQVEVLNSQRTSPKYCAM